MPKVSIDMPPERLEVGEAGALDIVLVTGRVPFG
jgi:hypothetical protein